MNNKKYKLNPNWVTGFVYGEECFTLKLSKSKRYKAGWYVQASFQVKLHIRDKDLLSQVKLFFKDVGTIWTNSDSVYYQVRNLNEIIKTIIPHFEKYPLITHKQIDFILFKSIIELMNKSEHLNKYGLMKIVNIKASLNNGLSDNLKNLFPNTVRVERPKFAIPINLDHNWIAGFTTGEGCFFIDIYKSKTNKIGYAVKLRALVGQHSRDELLMNNLINTLKCGNIFKHSNRNAVIFSVSRFKDIYNKVIPLFNKYKIEGIKLLDFKDFCEAAELMNKKSHLTLEGLEKIRNIKSKMNRNIDY